MKYRSMNVNHLLVDEVEYELAVRDVKFTSGESKDIKRRKLRNVMKSERDSGKYVSTPIDPQTQEKEFEMIDEKIARIKNKLENKKTKKAELPELETRMLHLYYRAIRLGEVYDIDGLDAIALKMLNDHFGFFTNNPEVNQNNSKRLIDQLRAIKDKNADADDEDETEDIDLTVKPKRATSTPKRKSNVKLRSDVDMMEKMMSRVDKMMSEKFKKMSLELDKKTEKINRQLFKDKPKKSEGKSKKELTLPFEEELEDDSEVEDESDDEEDEVDSDEKPDEPIQKRDELKRRPKAVSDWKIKYDGKDEGRGLNQFITEVEYMADAENITKRTLFKEAIHLFSGDARAWYIEGKKNQEFTKWSELVTELKLEYQPPDMDFHYEQQAAQRRQRRSEKFQDFYKAIQNIFQQMAIPPSEQRKFDIIFRNLRSDYKNALLVKGVRTLKMLRAWGRKLDSANWFLYRGNQFDQNSPKSAQIHEVTGNQQQQRGKPNGGDWKNRPQGNRPDWKNPQTGRPEWKNSQPQYQGSRGPPKDSGGQKKPHQENWKQDKQDNRSNAPRQGGQEGSSRGTLEDRVASYRIPDKTVCFNCRGNYHHFSACLKKREVFCIMCGFHDFTIDRCPVCAKNAARST